MSDLSEELPDVAEALYLPASTIQQEVSYRINLDKEIELRCQNYKKEQERLKITAEEVQEDIKDDIAIKECNEFITRIDSLQPVREEPPGVEFLKVGSSFCQLNADNLDKPDLIKNANSEDSILFYEYIRNTLQITKSKSLANDSQEVLRYLLFLASVHQDKFLVDCCLELLLEYNSQWKVDHKLLLAIFQNWGADIPQVLPSYPPEPVLTQENNTETVPIHNVDAVLQVLSAQLKLGSRIELFDLTNDFGLWKVDELVFGLLVLLSLDKKYHDCIPLMQDCVSELLTGVSQVAGSNWASEYCQLLLGLVENNYNLTSIVCRVLIGSSACETLQLNVCYAAIQKITGVALERINYAFDMYKFEWCIRSTTVLEERISEPIDIYCLLIFVDAIIRHCEVRDEKTLSSFCSWLVRFQSKIKQDTHITSLISDLEVLWERKSN